MRHDFQSHCWPVGLIVLAACGGSFEVEPSLISDDEFESTSVSISLAEHGDSGFVEGSSIIILSALRRANSNVDYEYFWEKATAADGPWQEVASAGSSLTLVAVTEQEHEGYYRVSVAWTKPNGGVRRVVSAFVFVDVVPQGEDCPGCPPDDLDGPSIVLLDSPANPSTNTELAYFRFALDDTSGVDNAICRMNQRTPRDCSAGEIQWQTLFTSVRYYTFTVTATDIAGNSSELIYEWEVIEDETNSNPPQDGSDVLPPLEDPIKVAEGRNGIKNGMIADFTMRDYRMPARASGNPPRLSNEFAYLDGLYSFHTPRYVSMNDTSPVKTAAKCRNEYVYFGGSDPLEDNRMQWNKDYWFGWASMVHADWQYPEGFEIITQIHDSVGGNGPPFTLSTAVPRHRRDGVNEGNYIVSQSGVGDIDTGIPVVGGVWHEWVLHYVPSKTGQGVFEFWADGQLIRSVSGINSASTHDKNTGEPVVYGPYFKQGIYHWWEDQTHDRDVYHSHLKIWGGPGGSFELVSPSN